MNHLDLDAIVLKYGGHKRRGRKSVCVMEAVAWFADEPHSDRPACTDPVVADYARTLNDRMPDDQRQRLKAYIPLLAGTKNGATPQARAFVCADRAVRVFAPIGLRAAGMDEQAAALEALAPVVDEATARAAYSAATSACSAATSAYSAATSAGSAAGSAATSADSAATSAYRAAASADSAAYSAAYSAYSADSAADSKAWDAALDLLRDLCEMGR